MKLELFPFQERAATDVLDAIGSAARNWSLTRDETEPVRTAFALSSVTGSGKTIIAASVIESLLFGSQSLRADPVEGATVLWVNYDPTLNKQTLSSFRRNADRIPTTHLHEVDSASFTETSLRAGHVYFLSLPLLGGTNRLTRTSESRDVTFWDVLANTVTDPTKTLVVVVDEAHIGMGGAKKTSTNETSILQRIINGVDDMALHAGHVAYEGAPVTWGISATPKRFHDRVAQLRGLTTRPDVVVAPIDVQTSGLLKKAVSLFIPDEAITMAVTMVYDALDELVVSTSTWASYCAPLAGEPVVPLAVMQLPHREDGKDLTAENEQIAMIVKAARETILDLAPDAIAHVIPDRGDIVVGDRTIRYVDPDVVSGHSHIRILLAKDSISTGWDCPRAEILLSLRPMNDDTAITQMLGRMIRTPLARETGVDVLDRVSCWVPYFDPTTAEDVIKTLTGQKEPDGRDKVPFEVDVCPVRYQLQVSDEPDIPTDDASGVQPVTVPSVGRPEVRPETLQDPTPSRHEPVVVDEEPVGPAPVPRAAIEAITVLPTSLAPVRTTSSSLVRMRRLAMLLGDAGIGPATPQRGVDDQVVAMFNHVRDSRPDDVAQALEQVCQAEMLVKTRRFADDVIETTRVVRRSRFDVITHECEIAARKTHDEAKVYLRHLSRQPGSSEYDDKALVAAICMVDGALDFFEAAGASYIASMLNRYGDDIALLTPAQQADFIELQRQTKEPVTTSIVLDPAKTYGGSGDGEQVMVPKHIYHDARGLWALPAAMAKNTWERRVLEREIAREAVVAWYRNPAKGTRDRLAVPYVGADGAWHLDAPDFLFVECMTDGSYKVAIVNPHWGADVDALARVQALADYAEANAGLLTRVDQVGMAKGSDRLRRLSLIRPAVREAVRAATSLDELYVSDVASDYPLS